MRRVAETTFSPRGVAQEYGGAPVWLEFWSELYSHLPKCTLLYPLFTQGLPGSEFAHTLFLFPPMDRNRPEYESLEAEVLEANGVQTGGQFFGAEEGFGGIGR